MTPSPELVDAAARVSALWATWDDPATQSWEAYFRLLDQYPGGSGGYMRDVEALARAWVTSRAASSASG